MLNRNKNLGKCFLIGLLAAYGVQAMDMPRTMAVVKDVQKQQGKMSPAQYERLKQEAAASGMQERTCSICREPMFGVPGRKVVALPCEHLFHEDCVIDWLNQHHTCPICRRPTESSQVQILTREWAPVPMPSKFGVIVFNAKGNLDISPIMSPEELRSHYVRVIPMPYLGNIVQINAPARSPIEGELVYLSQTASTCLEPLLSGHFESQTDTNYIDALGQVAMNCGRNPDYVNWAGLFAFKRLVAIARSQTDAAAPSVAERPRASATAPIEMPMVPAKFSVYAFDDDGQAKPSTMMRPEELRSRFISAIPMPYQRNIAYINAPGKQPIEGESIYLSVNASTCLEPLLSGHFESQTDTNYIDALGQVARNCLRLSYFPRYAGWAGSFAFQELAATEARSVPSAAAAAAAAPSAPPVAAIPAEVPDIME